MMKKVAPRPAHQADNLATTVSDPSDTPHAPLQKSPALDMNTVRTTAPPENPRTDPPTRIFGLQDAPCFYPTAEEFVEPLKYIESIRHEAEKSWYL